EADDPSMTQPEMYKLIDARNTVREQYKEDLLGRGELTTEDAEKVQRDFHDQMESIFEADDPSMTQPEMYKLIDARNTVREQYKEDLLGR
ncbi:hypothetical protein BWZ31_12665, partial [Neisseria meningitidis]